MIRDEPEIFSVKCDLHFIILVNCERHTLVMRYFSYIFFVICDYHPIIIPREIQRNDLGDFASVNS